jgi:PKHD-type hydroxylase
MIVASRGRSVSSAPMTFFAFSALRPRAYAPFVAWPEALSGEEVAAWTEIGDALPMETATVATGTDSHHEPDFRGARVGWIHPYPHTRALLDRLRDIAERLNAEHYGFDLAGLGEPVQYTVYDSPSVGYEWHEDMVEAPDRLQRKLSLTVQLSASDDYEGGDLELRRGAHVVTAPRGAGCVIAFPSWQLHRVTAVTRGVRRSVVAWVGGPAFR